MKWLKRWFSKRPAQQIVLPAQSIEPMTHVLTMQIDKTGKIQTNLPTELAQSVNAQTVSHICKVMGYIAILEMQSMSRTLH